jgi:uncharacterized protein
MKQAYIYKIPFEGKYIVYRPLLHAAFIGNGTMAELAERLVGQPDAGVPQEHLEAKTFLQEIGFLEPDPPPPAYPDFKFQPCTAVLLLTNRCNLRCTYCYAAAGEQEPGDMPLETAIRAIDIAAENAERAGREGFELVFHGGGEPPQHWEVFRKTVEHARGKKLKCAVSMSSNGVWGRKERSFIFDNFKGVSLSFDGMREIQDAQRPTPGGGSSFSAVMKNIEEMDRRKFPYNIRMTITTSLLEKFPESVRFICGATDCRNFQVEPAFGEGRVGWRNPNAEDADRFIRAFIEALDIAEEHERDLMYSGARPWMTVCAFCTAAESALVVRPDGALVACYEVTDARHELADTLTIGRLTSEGPAIDGTARARLNKMRRERLALCGDCFCIWHCGGDCSSRCFSPDGTGHLRFDQRCRINREISKEVLARYIERSGGLWKAKIEISEEGTDRASEKSEERRQNTGCDDCELRCEKRE